jgi:hypothetical protein
MADARTLLAAGLGVALGLGFLLAPEAVVQLKTAGRTPHDRRGEYGTETVPTRWRRLVRLVGAGLLLFGAYLGATAL